MSLFLEVIWAHMTHIDNKEIDILILGEGLTQRLDVITLTEDYPIDFT